MTGSLDLGNLVMKSIDMSSYGPFGIGFGCPSPYGVCHPCLFLWHIRHFLT